MSGSEMHHLTHWHALDDVTWRRLIRAARQHYRSGQTWTDAAHDRSLGLLFFNPSLRTRTSMELAAAQLGAYVTSLTAGDTWNFAWEEGTVMGGPEAEHIRDAIGVLSRYYDALGVRVFASGDDYEQDRSDRLMQTLADAATVPVINLESAFYHPCQALSDAATLAERFDGEAEGHSLTLTWTYHPKALQMAVPNSALLMATRMGMNVTVARPEGYPLDERIMGQARAYAAQHGAQLQETTDMDEAMDGADVVYAKSWGGPLSYTEPTREAELRQQHRDWRVTPARMARTRDGAFMHCLPVRRGVVVDDEVLDGPHSVHLTQAEFRIHAQKAMLEYAWGLEGDTQ